MIRNSKQLLSNLLVWGIVMTATAGTLAEAQNERLEVEAEAPPQHEIVRKTLGGAWFVGADLKNQYDDLLDQVRLLRADVESRKVTGQDAVKQLQDLAKQLEELRAEIERKKVLVSPIKLQKQTTETEFGLGPHRLVIITADRVKIRSWDGDTLKCVLEKTVVVEGDDPATEELAAIRVEHERRVPADLVGQTDAEYEAAERKFLESEAGRELNAEQLAQRKQLVDSIRHSYAPYHEYQGKEIDVLRLAGMTHQEGNQQFSLALKSPGGGGTYGGDWRRHADLTVYVPKCAGVIVRGCLVGLDVDGLVAPLILTDSGAHDRDYDGQWAVRNVTGSVSIFNIPVDVIENVTGDVNIISTVEYANSGTHHSGGRRVSYVPPTKPLTIREVNGNLTAWFGRKDVTVHDVSGRMDINNECGDTTVYVNQDLTKAAHRVISHSGRVSVIFGQQGLGTLPILAVTNHGSIRTNTSRKQLTDTSFTVGNHADGSRRNWRGMCSTKEEQGFDPLEFLNRSSRPEKILTGQDRSPGLDLISISGTIVIDVEKPEN